VLSPSRSTPKARPALVGLAATIALLAVAGCGSQNEAQEDEADPVGQELGGSVAALAQCSDWAGATEAQKLATIEDIRSQVNREDAGVTASALTDEQALKVLDHGCAVPGSQSFRLYIMYARAAAFEPLRRVAEGEETIPSE
jgi:hypothetical protein